MDEYIKLQQDYLETIVMIGPVADLTDKIKEADDARDTAKNAYEQQETVYKEFNVADNVKSPKHYIDRMANALRGDDNWAGRDRKIYDGRHNTGVREDTYMKFVSLTPSKQKTELLIDYKDNLAKLEDAKTGVSSIDEEVPSVPTLYSTYDDNAVQLLIITKEIEKPELSECERMSESVGWQERDMQKRNHQASAVLLAQLENTCFNGRNEIITMDGIWVAEKSHVRFSI